MDITPFLQDILPRVEKPSRYLGNELNVVHKDPDSVEVRIALAFPDLYDLGFSLVREDRLGVTILVCASMSRPLLLRDRGERSFFG